MSRISNFNEFLNETYSDIQGFVIAVMPKTLGDESTEVEDYHPMLISASTKKQAESRVKKWYKENHFDFKTDMSVVNADWEEFKTKVFYYDIKDLKKTVIGI